MVKRIAEVCWQLGIALIAVTIGSYCISVYKHEIPGFYMMTVAALGTLLVILGVFLGDYFDTVDCFFCEATIRRSFVKQDNESDKRYCCAVCRQKHWEYPIGSSNIPEKEKCAKCHQSFHRLPYMDGLGEAGWICRWCSGDLVVFPADPCLFWSIIMMILAIGGILLSLLLRT